VLLLAMQPSIDTCSDVQTEVYTSDLSLTIVKV